jgi:hypothetical protein
VKVETGIIDVPKKGKLVGLGVSAQRHVNRNTVAKVVKEREKTEQQDGEGRAKKQKVEKK